MSEILIFVRNGMIGRERKLVFENQVLTRQNRPIGGAEVLDFVSLAAALCCVVRSTGGAIDRLMNFLKRISCGRSGPIIQSRKCFMLFGGKKTANGPMLLQPREGAVMKCLNKHKH